MDHVFLCSSISTVSYMEEPGHHDDIPRPTVQMENTYRLSEYLFLESLFICESLWIKMSAKWLNINVMTVMEILISANK